MINKKLKIFLSTLTDKDFPLVIDCGHVDTKEIKPRIADGFTLAEGLECMEFLKQKTTAVVKLSILFNDTHLISNASSITEGRKQIRHLRAQVKSRGIHDLLLDLYIDVFNKYRISRDLDFFKSDFLYLSENSLILQSRQTLEKYRQNENPFKEELIVDGIGIKYNLKDPQNLSQDVKTVEVAYSHNGAPGWPLVSANITKFFDDRGFKTILCLRDEHWAPRVKIGGIVAKELYGCKVKTHAFFYN